MDIREQWEKALRQTEIIRPRILPLATFSDTHLPYIFLAESRLNASETVVRKGEVIVERPSLILPPNMPQFEGFDSEAEHFDDESISNFLLIRGIRFPSRKYQNKTYSLDVRPQRLPQAVESFSRELQREENVASGLVVGSEDCWQFSILIFICFQVSRSAEQDIKRIIERYRNE